MKDARFNLKFRSLLIVVLTFVIGFNVNAQKISVTGIVKDATGETVIGASVLEKGTTNGITTNFNGEFSLSVSSNATIVVSYVGYKTKEIPVAGQKNLTITLEEDAKILGEVVAIGYATVKKNDATGSVTAIKPEKLNKGLTTNAQDMITGKIAGVVVTSGGGTPGGGSTIRIRGGSSLNASNDPLIVIDGLAMDNEGIKGVANPLSTINPNDIESFTVLKDASATAIYGSRGSNGVILITTKKGEKGSKPRISYDGNVNISTIGKYVDVMTGDEYRDYVTKLYGKGSDAYNNLGEANTNTNWQSQIYQTAIGHDHNVNITGGLKNMPYRASFGYTNQDGILKTSNFERYTGAIGLNPSLFDDHLKISLNAKGMYVTNRYADSGAIGAAVSMDPTHSVYSDKDPYKSTFGGYWQWMTGNTYNSLAVKNPLSTLELKKDVAHSKDFIGNADFDYKFHFLPELRAHLTLGTEMATGKQDLYTQKTAASDGQLGRTGYEEITKYNRLLTYYMNYAKEIGSQKFDLMGGYEWQQFHRELNNKYTDLDLSGHPSSNVFKTESFLVSFFGRANYSILDRYLFTATVRRDGTSTVAPENRWGLFPSVAFAWKIKEESFLKDVNSISDLKLRLGYGVTGQQRINSGDYQYIPVYVVNVEGALYPIDGKYINTYRPNPYNKKLRWETTTTYNAGFDWGILNNRITGAIDAYYRVTDNLISNVNVAAGTNFSNIVAQNIGSLNNKGIEFSVTGKLISQKDLSWDISYNATYNRNEITKLTGTGSNVAVTDRGISSGTGNYIEYHQVGFPAFSYYVYEQVYDTNHKPIEGLFVDRNGDGKINDNDRYYYHNPAPDVTMGLSSKLIYKEFDFGVSLRASLNNYVYNDVDANRANVGQGGIWSTSGFLVNKPMSAFQTNFVGKTNYYFSDYYVQNASFVRVDNITVGYTFKNLFHVISSGRLSATVQNPFVITKYKGLDPEVFDGRDNNIYPRPVMSIIGLSLNF